MTQILDRPISKHPHNMKCWLTDVTGWDFSNRITYREMVHQIFNNKDMGIIKIDVPINVNLPFGGVKTMYKVRCDGNVTRDVPASVGEYYFSMVIESEMNKEVNTMTETTWDTEEVSQIIANDEGLYDLANRLEKKAHSIERLAQLMEEELSEWIESFPYSDVDLDQVDWEEIASEYTEEE